MSREEGKGNGLTEAVEVRAPAVLPQAVAEALAENGESLAWAIRLLGRMEREGTLQEMADLLALVKLVRGALTDDMVVSAARRIEALAAVVTDPVLAALVGRLPGALRAAEAEAAQAAASPPGLMTLLKELRDPAVRRGLAFFLGLAKHLTSEPPAVGKVDVPRGYGTDGTGSRERGDAGLQ